MGFGAPSDRFTALAWAVAAISLAVSVGLSLYVLALRRWTEARVRARERFVATWRPLMLDQLVGGSPALPAVRRADEESFLLLWIQLLDGVRGEARARLAPIAEAAGARRMIRSRIRGRLALGRLLALRGLGCLRDPADYGEVLRHLDEPRAYLCLAAARALVDLDPGRAPGDVLPRLVERTDWPIAMFSSVLAEADVARLSALLRELLPALSMEPLVRLLPLVDIAEASAGEGILRGLLAQDRDPDVLCAALKRVTTPSLAPLVRDACEHGSWAVRTQAAAALGRLGFPADRGILARLLGDREWWVRYRAAQALLSGKFGGAEEIRELAGVRRDRFARDIVEHVLGEARQ